MSDLIRRQDAIDVLATMQGRCTSKTALIQNSKIWQQIKDLPSAQPTIDAVEVVHGEWKFIGDSEEPQDGVFMCSVCGGFLYDALIDDCKYCPHCGAKMDGEVKSDEQTI